MKTFTLFSLFAAGSALAHLQMQDPYPIMSPLNNKNPSTLQGKDWDYTAPLVANGLPYPCKGHLSADASLRSSQKSWAAGSTQAFTIAPPGAIHGGGSCQLSLSYDMGKTWNVIYSYIGGCMAEDLTNSFVIPKAAPGGEAVFSWTWFNRQGNREMYQNCAIVTITDGGSGLNSRDHPAPFVANAGINSCTTIENNDIVFPNPGATVKYSGEYKGTTPVSGRGIVGTGCVHPGGADGAGTKSGSGYNVGDSNQLAASPSVNVESSSSSASASTPSIAPAPAADALTSSTLVKIVSSSASTSPNSTPTAATSPTAIPLASPPSKQKPQKCRKRRSGNGNIAQIARDISPAAAHAHKERRARRQGGLGGTRRSNPEVRSGRVAAMQAVKPVYAD